VITLRDVLQLKLQRLIKQKNYLKYKHLNCNYLHVDLYCDYLSIYLFVCVCVCVCVFVCGVSILLCYYVLVLFSCALFVVLCYFIMYRFPVSQCWQDFP